MKGKVHKTVVRPAVLYGGGGWGEDVEIEKEVAKDPGEMEHTVKPNSDRLLNNMGCVISKMQKHYFTTNCSIF